MKLGKKTPAGLAAALGVAFAATLGAFGCGGKHEAKDVSPSPVTAATAKAEAVEVPDLLELYGTVAADSTAAIGSRVMANVVAVPVKVGDLVKAGDVLVEIDPQTAKGQEAQARGALAQARGALALAERNYQRFQALAKTGSASELELDMARMQYEQAKGALQQGEGAVEAASSVAKESRVVAPFPGRVAARMVEPGDFAAPGRPLVTVESAAGRRLVVSVPASAAVATGLKAGQKVAVRVDGIAAPLTGVVAEVSPGADPSSHTFTAKIELAGAPIAAGLTGRAALDAGRRKAVLVPQDAVLAAGGISLVAVRDADGKARSRAVTTGAAHDGRVEVLSGLSGGEIVLVGLKTLPPDGAPVTEPPK